jgi:hypothetical protein
MTGSFGSLPRHIFNAKIPKIPYKIVVVMSDELEAEEMAFVKKLEELRNLSLHSDGLVSGRDFREVILRQMELNYGLFHRQHHDVKKLQEGIERFTASAERLEKLTYALIGLTLLLGGLSIYDLFIR